jgi:hypothetical protein
LWKGACTAEGEIRWFVRERMSVTHER